jgi:microcompartment protein CcmL/EutN
MSSWPTESASSAEPALGLLEVGSIARGVFVVDALKKRAEVRMLRADPVTPGKLLLLFAGGVAEVEESFEAALEAAAESVLGKLLLPQVHHALVPALDGVASPVLSGSVGVLEFSTASATLGAADAALKETDVTLMALHLCRGVGGKGYFAFCGSQGAVEASLEAGDLSAAPGERVGYELIARPDASVDWVLERL